MTAELPLAFSPELSGIPGLLRFSRDPLGSLRGVQARHGDLVLFVQRNRPNILVSDPAAIEAVLVSRHAEFKKDLFTNDLSLLLGQGLLTSEGDAWKGQRRLMAPSFQPREIARFGETMVESAERALGELRPGTTVDVYGAMMRLALDVVARTLFGSEFKRFAEVEECLSVADRSFRQLWRTWRAFVRTWLPVAPLRRLARARERLNQMVLEMIREKRAHPGEDLLSRLLTLRDESGQGMSDEEVRDQAITVFLAGHETTALALTYTLHLLATHPEAYRKLEEELARELGGRRPTVSDVPRLAFTNAVIKESLRLYPPVWAMAREALTDLDLYGARVSRGTQVITSQWVVQRDARWFQDPDRFVPERWQAGLAAKLPRFAYFPFGGGPRVCIGQHFALLEIALVVARLCQTLRFARPPGERLQLSPVVTLRPQGPVRFELRQKARGEALGEGFAAQ